MRTVLFAYHDIGCAGMAALHRLGEEICAVFTHEDDPEENVWFGSVKKDAQKLGVPVFTPADANKPEWIGKIRALRPDILFSFYYRRMISEEVLRLAPKGG